jgi:hypothetical protein
MNIKQRKMKVPIGLRIDSELLHEVKVVCKSKRIFLTDAVEYGLAQFLRDAKKEGSKG